MENYIVFVEHLDKKIIMVNFVLGDFLAKINYAKRLKSKAIKVNYSRMTLKLLILFLKLGLIRGFKILDNNMIEVLLKFVYGKTPFKTIKLVSKPSRRIHVDLIKLRKLKDNCNMSIYILSTNKGIKLDFECLVENISGEVLIKIEF